MKEPSSFDLPLFVDPPQDLDEESTGGFIIGGMAARTDALALAREFRTAADRLVETYIDGQYSYEVACPILYLYRHSLELYLKAVTNSASKTHDIPSLIEKLDMWSHDKFGSGLTTWVKERLNEFHKLDPGSSFLRYADGGPKVLGGDEHWVDLGHLRWVFGIITHGLESAVHRPIKIATPQSE